GPDGVVRGQIVHQVLEHLGERELDRLLEDAIGRWDPDAPTPEHAEGLAYREALRAEVERVADHPEYRALAERPGARRELEFVHLAGADGDGYLEGKIDLASRSADGVMLLDVKTYQGTDPAQLAAVAARYRLQRDAYVAAVEAIAGEPVARFAFHFSRAGRQVVSAITAGDRAAARERLAAMLREIGQGEPGLARDAGDCRWCGYRAVGWCEGAAGS
ncbi:MAG TPA: PD-(D/E)XK nuclease family protein, partial [Vicinamibacterales bacterium]|nr:PD-(D/E)XK nuclease family protein [Vicinamibacterales bacterium]